MKEISIINMFDSKVHFGHLKRFVSPKMKKYIYGINNKISIINLDISLKLMTKALNFIESIIKNNGKILFVGTKRQASKLVKDYAEKTEMPYVNFRWLGGLLTNYKTIKKSVKKLNEMEEKIKKEDFEKLTKKEKMIMNKNLEKLKFNFGGIKNMTSIPDALFIIDTNYEKKALLEAMKLLIPIIAIVDTNSNPDGIDYIIPGNDDSMNAINFYLKTISEHIINLKNKGKE